MTAPQALQSEGDSADTTNRTGISSGSLPKLWPIALGASTFLLASATVLLHFLGTAIHRTYLSNWGISSNLFPKSSDWLLINGYYGISNGIALLYLAMMENKLLTCGIVLPAVLYIWALSKSWTPSENTLKKLAAFKQWPKWRRIVLTWTLVSVFSLAAVVWLTVVLMLLLSMPARAGSFVGKDTYERHIADMSKGCEKSASPCVQVLQGNSVLGMGYAIDSSANHFAYFDLVLQRSRVIPLENLEIRALRSPKGYIHPFAERPAAE